MAGAEKIQQKILEEAHLQAQNNIKQAEDEKAGILEAARQEAENKRKAILEKAQQDAAETKRRILAVAELEVRKQKLQAKQEMVEEAFRMALHRLNTMENSEYELLLIDMIANLAKTGKEEIILSSKDKQRLSPDFVNKVNEKLNEKGITGLVKISDESRNIDGGFILKSGDVEINNSFDAMIRMQRNELEAEVVQALFN